MTVLRAAAWIAVVILVASCPQAELGPDGHDLRQRARSLGLATIFSFADESLSPSHAIRQHFVTALSITRGCDLAHEWLQRNAMNTRRVIRDDQSCGIVFGVRPGIRGMVRGFLEYEGCLVFTKRPHVDVRDVHLTLVAAPHSSTEEKGC